MNGENKFWQFNVGHLLTMGTMVVLGIGTYFKMDARLIAVELLSNRTSILVEKIDQNGSQGTKERVSNNDTRISVLEKKASASEIRLERIDTNILTLMSRATEKK